MKVLFKIKITGLTIVALLFLNSCSSNNENLCHEGKLLYEQGNYKAAIEKFDAYLAANPEFKKGFLNWNPTFELALTAMGNAYFQTNQYEKAIDSYNQSIDIGGEHANNEANYFNRGMAQFYLNKKEEARESFDQVDDRKFDNSNTLLFKSDIFSASAELDTAMFLIQKCVELNEKNGDALIRKVHLWIQKNELDSASTLFSNILGMKNSTTFSLFTKNTLILDSYYAPTAVENDNAVFYTGTTADKIGLNEFSKASASLGNALKFSENPISILLQSGDVNMALGNIDEAIEFYDKALAWDILNIDASWKKANALIVKGEKDSAKSLYEQVLAKDPENMFAFVALKLFFQE